MTENIFFQISALLGITISIAFFVRLLKQPLIVAYIIAGIVSGPLFLNLINNQGGTYQAFAEFGIVLLLFVIGLNLNFSHLKKIGKVSLLTGLGQFFFTTLFGSGLMLWLGLSWQTALYLAVAMTFSSTIIVMKLISDKKDGESVYGRYTLGLLLIQDIIAIAILFFIGTIYKASPSTTPLPQMLITMLTLIVAIVLTTKFVLPMALKRIAQSGEFLFIFTVAWCFGIASLVYASGFSLEIGAIIAGLSLGSSPYQPEISSRIKPLRDFFIVLFFVILGSEMVMSDLRSIWLPALVMSLFVLIGNPIILYIIYRTQKFTRRNSFLGALTVAQVSEFGFILLITGQTLGHISSSALSLFTTVALTTICVSSYLITYNEQIYRWFIPFFNRFGKDKVHEHNIVPKKYDVWVFGYHRIGWRVCRSLEEKKISYAVVDYNPHTITKLKKMNIPAYFGDAADVEFLESLPLSKAKAIILTIPAADDQLTLISHVRQMAAKPKIIANLYHYARAEELYAAGANFVMLPHLLGGQWLADFICHKQTAKDYSELRSDQKKEMAMRREIEM